MCSRWRPASWGSAPASGQLLLPTDEVEVLVLEEGKQVVRAMEWGLIPSWSREKPRPPRFNARSETILEKPSFRESIKGRRGVLKGESYVEYINKVQHEFCLPDGPMLMAAIWDEWVDPASGEIVRSCATITCGPNEQIEVHHDRMPVILHPDDVERWLTGTLEEAMALLVPWQGELIITPTGSQGLLAF
jgi:putative SOS response-associated peptidase YedK